MLRLSEKMNRLGTETAFEVLARAETLAREGRDIINLGIGQPDFKTPGHILRKLQKLYVMATTVIPHLLEFCP